MSNRLPSCGFQNVERMQHKYPKRLTGWHVSGDSRLKRPKQKENRTCWEQCWCGSGRFCVLWCSQIYSSTSWCLDRPISEKRETWWNVVDEERVHKRFERAWSWKIFCSSPQHPYSHWKLKQHMNDLPLLPLGFPSQPPLMGSQL